MNRFLKKILLFFILIVVIVPILTILILYSLSTLKETYTRNSHEINVYHSIEKLKLASNNRRIILVGGSNVGFGVNSEIIEKQFGLSVINTSAHAGIGLRFQVELVKDYLTDGDIVVLIPEYQQYYGQFYGDQTAPRIVSTFYFGKYITYLRDNFFVGYKYLPSAIFDMFNSVSRSNNSNYGVYDKLALNRFGDCILQREDGVVFRGIDKQIFVEDFDECSVDYIKYFKRYTQDNGIEFLLLPPVYQESSYLKNMSAINFINNILKENNVQFLVSSDRYRFNDSLFYDTPYHLNNEGIVMRTNLLIEDIKSYIDIKE